MQVIIANIISNILLIGIYFVLANEYAGYIQPVDSISNLDVLQDLIFGLKVPIPTIPILACLSMGTIFSMPPYFLQTRIREIQIRFFCGAQKRNVVLFISGTYAMYQLFSFLFCILVVLLLGNHNWINGWIWILFAIEVCYAMGYFLCRKPHLGWGSI
jgi:hypothetical protein